MTIHALKRSLYYARQELRELESTPDQYSTYTKLQITHFIHRIEREVHHAQHRL